MSFGVRMLNPSGYVQIDEDYTNYGLLFKGFSANDTFIEWPGMTAELRNRSVLVGRPATGVGDVLGGYQDLAEAPNWTFRYGWRLRGTASQYEYAVYLPSDLITPPQEGYGIEVYRPDSRVVFTSKVPPLNVVASSTFAPSESGTVINLPTSSIKRFGFLNQSGQVVRDRYIWEQRYRFTNNNSIRVVRVNTGFPQLPSSMAGQSTSAERTWAISEVM